LRVYLREAGFGGECEYRLRCELQTTDRSDARQDSSREWPTACRACEAKLYSLTRSLCHLGTSAERDGQAELAGTSVTIHYCQCECMRLLGKTCPAGMTYSVSSVELCSPSQSVYSLYYGRPIGCCTLLTSLASPMKSS